MSAAASESLSKVLAGLDAGPLSGRFQRDAPVGDLTTYRVGGAAAAHVVLEEEADLDAFVTALGGHEVAVLVLGRGSNLLISDAGFEGIAVSLSGKFSAITVESSTVTAGGAAKLPVVARTAVQAGLAGLEWAVGVPGSVGGAVRMNAGGHGAEIVDSLTEARVVDLRTATAQWRAAAQLDLGYRRSSLTPSDLVLEARFELTRGSAATGKAEMMEIVQWRRDNQPGGQNAGSVFTNPPGDSAGRLIDDAGLKGHRIGTAAVSDKHANFIQADPGGRAADVLAVMDEVQRRVREVHGVELHPETHLVGFTEECEQ